MTAPVATEPRAPGEPFVPRILVFSTNNISDPGIDLAGIELEVRFFHCNGRHHSVALARAPFEMPQCLHHVMFEANSRDDVGAAFDRAWEAGLPIPNGLGRHDNDGMFSFYVQSPAGFQVEVGHGARQISEPWANSIVETLIRTRLTSG